MHAGAAIPIRLVPLVANLAEVAKFASESRAASGYFSRRLFGEHYESGPIPVLRGYFLFEWDDFCP